MLLKLVDVTSSNGLIFKKGLKWNQVPILFSQMYSRVSSGVLHKLTWRRWPPPLWWLAGFWIGPGSVLVSSPLLRSSTAVSGLHHRCSFPIPGWKWWRRYRNSLWIKIYFFLYFTSLQTRWDIPAGDYSGVVSLEHKRKSKTSVCRIQQRIICIESESRSRCLNRQPE